MGLLACHRHRLAVWTCGGATPRDLCFFSLFEDAQSLFLNLLP
jgi:hypothetical protein